MPFGRTSLPLAGLVFALSACAAAPVPPPAPPAPPPPIQAEGQIITRQDAATARELMDRGEHALGLQQWRVAIDAFETLVAAERAGADAPPMSTVLYHLALAYEGNGERERARDCYHQVADRYPTSAEARAALERAEAIHALLEEWSELGKTAETLLARPDLEDVDKLTGLGARGLSRVEQGDDAAAMRDIQDGLDIVDTLHFGAENRLPVGAAQLRFALAEVRRVRSEKIALTPVTPDFLVKIEMRCQGLLDAQNAYADAIRSIDPRWAAMSGYRIGSMYRALHRELMAIPPTALAKSDGQKQLFFAMMHVRYRALLDKGLEMMRRTVALGAKLNDTSSWVTRAEGAQKEMEVALEDEKATIAKLPYSEETVQKALDLLQKKVEAKSAAK